MKFLLDMPVPQATAAWLLSAGHDARHARDIGLARAADEDILERAQREGRVVLTMDLDFPRLLAALSVDGPGVILIRLRDARPEALHRRLQVLLETVAESDLARSIAVLEETAIRLHRLPLP